MQQIGGIFPPRFSYQKSTKKDVQSYDIMRPKVVRKMKYYIEYLFLNFFLTKGQIISEGLFVILKFSQKNKHIRCSKVEIILEQR